MRVEIVDNLSGVAPREWNNLAGTDANPFLRHEFLHGLERFGCVGEQWGWYPHHLLLWDEAGGLAGAAPLYLKDNSYGELVFDWSWADAYRRAGLRYYPKLVSAVPYTPVTGPRLLVRPGADAETVRQSLAEAGLALARELEVSSLHWLFPERSDMAVLEHQGLMRRTGCQFHWYNRGYRDFDDFLDTFSSKKRKNLKRERRRVAEAGIELEVRHGDEMQGADWARLHGFYRSTFERLGGYATLSLPFFEHLGETMAQQMVTVFAYEGRRPVAAAFSLRGRDALFGRHWGCVENFDGLHFEACYYQGIDYCIRHGLARFEPGAQGEHKVGRGFEPTPTHSAHWLAHPEFGNAVARFVDHEHELMGEYMDDLRQHLPFKRQ